MTLTQRLKKPGYRVLLVAALMIAGMNYAYKCEMEEQQYEKTNIVNPSPQQIALTNYFERKGSPHPERMATAVLETKKPRLLAAVAAVESQGKETAYNKRSKAKGAFQVKAKYWGRVPKDAVEQALQADRILAELDAECNGNLQCALNKYGGDTKRKVYAKNILKELQQVP